MYQSSGYFVSILAFAILTFLVTTTNAQVFNYESNIVADQNYYIYNEQYGNFYPSNTVVKWSITSPVGTQINLFCEEINIPATTNCSGDKIAISLTGSRTFADAHTYCGSGTNLELVSISNKLTFGIFATWYSTGGLFMCVVKVQGKTCDCGWKKINKIVGGTETAVNEYASMAGLVDSTVGKLICGTSIISDRFTVTAAHCVVKKSASNLGVLVGDHKLSSGTETNSARIEKVLQIIIHEKYNANTDENDIALLKTQNVIIFSLQVGPICLPFKYKDDTFVGKNVTVLGWGSVGLSDPTSDVLLAANLSIVSNYQCSLALSQTPIFNTQICSFAVGKDACQFDSGGPLLWLETVKARYFLTGLVSFGLSCASSKPGVNTRITSFLPWIRTATSNYNFCEK